MAMKKRFYSVNGQMMGYESGGVKKDFLTDHLGSITAEIDQTQTRTYDTRYSAYGRNNWSTGTGCGFGWVGSYGYRETGLFHMSHYVRARHYSYITGNWSTVDPLWPDESAYGYVGGLPNRVTDPMGTSKCEKPCCCQASTFFSGWPSTLNGVPSKLDPTGTPGIRYGHLINLFAATTAIDSKIPGGDCTLKWYECSNFQLTPGSKGGTWVDRTAELARAKGFDAWIRRKFDCDNNRKWSGILRDEPTLSEARAKTKGGRILYIRAILKSGGGECSGQLTVDLTQQIVFQNGKVELRLINGLIPVQGLCENPPVA